MADFRSLWVSPDPELDQAWRVWNVALGGDRGDCWADHFKIPRLDPVEFGAPQGVRFQLQPSWPAAALGDDATAFVPEALRDHAGAPTPALRAAATGLVGSARLPLALACWRLARADDPAADRNLRLREREAIPWLATGDVEESPKPLAEREILEVGDVPLKVLAAAAWGRELGVDRVRLLVPAQNRTLLSPRHLRAAARGVGGVEIREVRAIGACDARRVVVAVDGVGITVQVDLVESVGEALAVVWGLPRPRRRRRWVLPLVAVFAVLAVARWLNPPETTVPGPLPKVEPPVVEPVVLPPLPLPPLVVPDDPLEVPVVDPASLLRREPPGQPVKETVTEPAKGPAKEPAKEPQPAGVGDPATARPPGPATADPCGITGPAADVKQVCATLASALGGCAWSASGEITEGEIRYLRGGIFTVTPGNGGARSCYAAARRTRLETVGLARDRFHAVVADVAADCAAACRTESVP